MVNINTKKPGYKPGIFYKTAKNLLDRFHFNTAVYYPAGFGTVIGNGVCLAIAIGSQVIGINA